MAPLLPKYSCLLSSAHMEAGHNWDQIPHLEVLLPVKMALLWDDFLLRQVESFFKSNFSFGDSMPGISHNSISVAFHVSRLLQFLSGIDAMVRIARQSLNSECSASSEFGYPVPPIPTLQPLKRVCWISKEIEATPSLGF